MIKVNRIPIFLCLIIGLTSIKIDAASILNKQSPDFILTDSDENEVSLSELKGKPVLLLFADESELSQEKLATLVEIYDYYLASELKILPIVTGKDPEEALEFQDELWLTYNLYGDPQRKVSQLYGVKQFPQVVILDNDHLVRYVGDYTTDEELRRELFRWMNEKVIVVTARQFEYSPNIITVNKGDKVLIKLLPEDVTHGMYIDAYEKYVTVYMDRDGKIVSSDMKDPHIKPGELGLLRFVANKSGKFTMRCASTCAAFHPYMMGWLKVLPNTRYYFSVFSALLVMLFSMIVFSKDKNKNRILGLFRTEWRFDLTKYSFVRKLCKSRWLPNVGIWVNLFFFTIILIACFTGGTSAGNYNFGIMLVWIVWYALLMMLLVPFFSRFWCMICPLPFFGDLIQRLSLMGVRKKLAGFNLRWPKKLKNMWLVNFLFIGTTFANGFLTTRPIASFIMFAVIIFLATFIALIYEKRTFCLYVCPIGGFQGLYSNMATMEIRTKDRAICKKHSPKTCFIGNDKGYGCPWMEAPFIMNRNTYCGMCLECFKSCPKDNMVINLRPPGVDILVDEKRGLDESWKAFIMIGSAIVFYVFMMGPWGFLKDWQNAKTLLGLIYYILTHSLFTLVLLPATFGIFVFIAHKVVKSEVSYKKMFINYSYSLLPIGLLIWFAFSLGFLLPNGSYVLGVISDPFAWGWNLFGTGDFPWTPFLTGLMPYLQVLCLLFGLVFSVDIGVKLAQQMHSKREDVIKSFIPIGLYLLIMTIGLLWLFVG